MAEWMLIKNGNYGQSSLGPSSMPPLVGTFPTASCSELEASPVQGLENGIDINPVAGKR